MASPLHRRLPTLFPSRPTSFIKPQRIQTVSPLGRYYSSSSPHSNTRKASGSNFYGRATAFGCLGVVGIVGLAFGAAARSQQQAIRRDQQVSATATVVEDTSAAGSNEQLDPETTDDSEDPSASSSPQQSAFNPETGEINWDCPCLGGMAHGVCGEQFKAAFGCFVYSEAEPKGVECIEKFKLMQDCFKEHPDVYGEELIGQEDDQQPNEDQEEVENEHDSRTLSAPTPPSEPEESLNSTSSPTEQESSSSTSQADQSRPTNPSAATTSTSD